MRKRATRMPRIGPQVGAKPIGWMERGKRETGGGEAGEGGRRVESGGGRGGLPTPSFKHTHRELAPAPASLEWRTINLHIAAVLINAAESS